MKNKGLLLFITFDDLLMSYAKHHDLADYSILVVSNEISGSLKVRSAMAGVSTGIAYESKYENIEFVPSLKPTPNALEYLYSGNQSTRFAEMYENHLISAEPFIDLCSVVDMVVNSDCKVIVTMASYEFAGKIPWYLREFIEDEFGLHGYVYPDTERLIKHRDDKKTYEKILATIDFDVPDDFDGIHLEPILQNYGDVEAIKEKLELQKVVAASLNSRVEDDDLKSVFFNRFTEDLESKVREILMSRTETNIKDVCRTKRIRISPSATKESLVEKILHEMRLDCARTVEYH